MTERSTLPAEKSPPTGRQAISRTASQSAVSPVDHLVSVQRTLGNRTLQALLKANVIQAQLKIGAPGDIYEQEADRVAETVMRMPEPGAVPRIQRVCSECEEELHRQPAADGHEEGGDISFELESSVNSQRSGGQPLSESSRNFFEPRFGYDFSHVRLHTDALASESAKAVNARAFTIGDHIVFGATEYEPDTIRGQRLLAHELVHVIQQTGHSAGHNQAQRSPVEQRLASPVVQGKWHLDRVKADDHEEISYARENGSRFSMVMASDKNSGGMVMGAAHAWQEQGFPKQKYGGEAQIAHWVTKQYIFKNDGTDKDFLQVRSVGEVAGNAKAEALRYARASSIVWGRVTERTAANPTGPNRPMFELKDGGISAATVGDLGVIEIEIPIGEDGSAKITIPLKRVDEGAFAPFSSSSQNVHESPSPIGETEILLGARISADADIESSWTGISPWISQDENQSRASGTFDLKWESRPAPAATPPPPAPDAGIAAEKKLSYPNDCNRSTLVRAGGKDGCSTDEGGNHTNVRKNGAVITQIPRSVKENNTCRSIIKVLNENCLS